ncbi:pheromone-binding protein-like [Ostrinia furnacalis]|uniref:pheromone-binding protein-like n=1 Tax=Ostrinia furnacalis TaxID=93504 RepID=UPI00103E94F8|nr:pheromone-binding protein-like [Ostrinia furnacalis]
MFWCQIVNGLDNALVLKTASISYGRKVYPCLQELHLGEDILTDLLNYWKEDYEFTNKDIGCAVICVHQKLHLLDTTGGLDPPHTQAFVQAAGGDVSMGKYVSYLYKSCEKVANATDPCVKALEATNCFRKAVHRAQWSPNKPIVIEKKSDG